MRNKKSKKFTKLQDELLRLYVSNIHVTESERQSIERALNQHNIQFDEHPLYQPSYLIMLLLTCLQSVNWKDIRYYSSISSDSIRRNSRSAAILIKSDAYNDILALIADGLSL